MSDQHSQTEETQFGYVDQTFSRVFWRQISICGEKETQTL